MIETGHERRQDLCMIKGGELENGKERRDIGTKGD